MKLGILGYLVVLAVVLAVVIIAIPCKAVVEKDTTAAEPASKQSSPWRIRFHSNFAFKLMTAHGSEQIYYGWQESYPYNAHSSRFTNSWRSHVAFREAKMPRPDYQEIKSAKLSCSLDDPEAAWKYMTAPDTPYIQRLALAYRGDEWFPPRFMNRLMEARNLLRCEQQLHYWGMKLHPHNALIFQSVRSWRSLQDLPDSLGKRKILGSQWTVPSAESDYPLTWEEECAAPWPWQVQDALHNLLHTCMNQPFFVDQPANPWWDQWIDEALKMPCRTDREAVSFVAVTSTSVSWKYPKVLSRWLSIAENPEFVDGTRSVVFALSSTWQKMTSYAMILEFIQKSPHRKEIGQLCIYLKNLTESMRETNEYGRTWTPNSAVLVLGRYVNDPEYGSEWTRLNWAFTVCEIVSDPPFRPDHHMDMDSPLVPKKLAEFKVWFDEHEAELVAASEKEKPALDAIIEKIRKSK